MGRRAVLIEASRVLRELLEGMVGGEVQLPGLEGGTLETLVRVMEGEVAVDLAAQGSTKLRAGAEVLGLLPPAPLAMGDLMALVGANQGWPSPF